MTHTVLARKWRPKRFADLVGQHNTVTILQNIISTGRLHHAYLLTGTRGVGKTTIARIIAKALNCLNPQNHEPCGQCDNCRQIDNGRFVDVIEIDAASNTGVDNIREVLENAQYAPTSGKYKIYIIDEVHMLSKSAFNAMLKTLEEPPSHVVFILATTDPQKVPITILSRCLQLKLRNLSTGEIETHLGNVLTQENYQYEHTALELLAHAASGSMRDALSLTDQAIAFSNGVITTTIVQQMLGISDDSTIITLLTAINHGNSNLIVEICRQLNNDGANLENILEQINQTLFKIGVIQLSSQPDATVELKTLANNISLQDCQLYFEISNLGLEQIRKISHKYSLFTMTLLRMVAFTIGSSKERQIIISANNCHSQVSEVAPQPQSTPPEVINNATEITPISIATALEEPPIIVAEEETNQVNIEVTTPPWDDLPTSEEMLSEMNELDTVAIHATEHNLNPYTPNEDSATSEAIVSLTDFNWLEFVKTLNLNTIPQNAAILLNNAAQIEVIKNNELRLQINDVYRPAVDANCIDCVEKLLFDKLHAHVDLSIDFTHSKQGETHKDFTYQQQEQLQMDAIEAIKTDPIVQDMQNNFGAKIFNITPVNAEDN